MSQTCCTIAIPGPPGNNAGPGTNGTNGTNAYTKLSVQLVMPASMATVVATVLDTSWMVIGEPLYVATLGTFLITAIPTTTTVTLQNLGYASNASPGTIAPPNSILTPTGFQGSTGGLTGAAGGVLSGTYPNPLFSLSVLQVNGDLITMIGGAAARLAGAVGVLHGGVATPPSWAAVNLASGDVTGILPLANGGTGNSSASVQALLNYLCGTPAKGKILASSATNWTTQTPGTDGYAVIYDSTQANGLNAAPLSSVVQSYGSLGENGLASALVVNSTYGTSAAYHTSTVGIVKGAGYVTYNSDAGGDNLEIGVSGGGTYDLQYQVSFEQTSGTTLYASLFKNSVQISSTESIVDMSPGLLGMVAGFTLAALVPGDKIGIKFHSEADSKGIKLNNVTLIIKRIE